MEFKSLLMNTKIAAIMDNDPITISIDADFSQAQEKFLQHKVSHLVVVDENNTLMGILSQKYLFKTQSPRRVVSEEIEYDSKVIIDGNTFYDKEMLDSFILKHVMMKNPFSLSGEDSVAQAINSMSRKKLGCIPIVDKNMKVRGVVTHFEIIDFLSQHLTT